MNDSYTPEDSDNDDPEDLHGRDYPIPDVPEQSVTLEFTVKVTTHSKDHALTPSNLRRSIINSVKRYVSGAHVEVIEAKPKIDQGTLQREEVERRTSE